MNKGMIEVKTHNVEGNGKFSFGIKTWSKKCMLTTKPCSVEPLIFPVKTSPKIFRHEFFYK